MPVSKKWFSACSLCAVSVSTPSFAATDNQIEEIIVTAQKRAESLQVVPISVQVVSGDEQRRKNQNSLHELAQTVPSLHLGTQVLSSDMYLRGIGSGFNAGFDQSLATFVDDIYHGRSRVTQGLLLDIDRVEVLRGPQSTYFGNSAIAGALNIASKKPGGEFNGWTRGLYGMHGQFAAEGAVGVPITDKLSVRTAASFSGTNGWIKNVWTGDKVGRVRNEAGRLSLRYQPTDDLDINLKVEGSRSETDTNNAQVGQLTGCPPPPEFLPMQPGNLCAVALASGAPVGLDNNEVLIAEEERTKLTGGEVVLKINYEQWGHIFTSVTGYIGHDSIQDSTGTPGIPLALFAVRSVEEYRQFSQELRIASPTGQPIEYLAGVYFQDGELKDDLIANVPALNGLILTAPPPFSSLAPYLPLSQFRTFDQREKQYSVFGSVTWNVTGDLKLSAGIRGSWVRKNNNQTTAYGAGTSLYDGFVAMPTAPFSCGFPFGCQALAGLAFGPTTMPASGSRKDSDWTPSVKVQYQMTPDVMVYASYTEGFKAGGFNAFSGLPASEIPFGPETVKAYEIGLKSELFDNTVRLNLNLFRSDYSDLQVATFVLDTTVCGGNPLGCMVVTNAAASRSQGVEFEGQWRPDENFSLATNLSYLDAKYTDYKAAQPTVSQSFQGQTIQDLSGRRTLYAPKWSGSVTASYAAMISDFRITTTVSPNFSSGYFMEATLDPLFVQDSYLRLDARVTFDRPDSRWAVDIIGKNLTNEIIKTESHLFINAPGSGYASKQEPWNIAVQLRYSW